MARWREHNRRKAERPAHTGLKGRLTARMAVMNNMLVDSEERLGELIEQLLAAGQLPSREDVSRVRRRIANLRRILLDIDAALDQLK